MSIESETGRIYYRNHEIAFGKAVLFRLMNFLWAHEIVVNGARAI